MIVLDNQAGDDFTYNFVVKGLEFDTLINTVFINGELSVTKSTLIVPYTPIEGNILYTCVANGNIIDISEDVLHQMHTDGILYETFSLTEPDYIGLMALIGIIIEPTPVLP